MSTTKDSSIDRLLSNSVYAPDSGLIERLRRALGRLSATDLADLLLIVELKMDEAAEDAA